MKSAVIVFPGSNCDRDAAVALENAAGQAPFMVWHGDSDLPKVDLIVVPGGFSYSDYLRAGAMAENPGFWLAHEKAHWTSIAEGRFDGHASSCETHCAPRSLASARR